jgi:hypothetical protein
MRSELVATLPPPPAAPSSPSSPALATPSLAAMTRPLVTIDVSMTPSDTSSIEQAGFVGALEGLGTDQFEEASTDDQASSSKVAGTTQEEPAKAKQAEAAPVSPVRPLLGDLLGRVDNAGPLRSGGVPGLGRGTFSGSGRAMP